MKVGIVDKCGAQVLVENDACKAGTWQITLTNNAEDHFSNYFRAVIGSLTKAQAREVGEALLKFAGEL